MIYNKDNSLISLKIIEHTDKPNKVLIEVLALNEVHLIDITELIYEYTPVPAEKHVTTKMRFHITGVGQPMPIDLDDFDSEEEEKN